MDSPILNLCGKCVNFHDAVKKCAKSDFPSQFSMSISILENNFLITFFSKNGPKLCRFGEISVLAHIKKKYFKGMIYVGLKYVLNSCAA